MKSMTALPRIASRIFGEPLAIELKKLEIIVAAIEPRLRGSSISENDDENGEDPTDAGYEVIDGVAVIDISGTLVSKSSWMNSQSGLMSYSSVQARFDAALNDPTVGGILLAIDTPGGEVSGMFDLAARMYQARGEKPICAVVDCACSAGYLLASAADQILVSRTGAVGSIGIIALHRDQSGADQQNGLSYAAIYAGDRKNDGNPHAPLSAAAKISIQGRIDQVYDMFTADVARNRKRTDSSIRGTQAQIYLGQSGVDVGLADSVGSIDTAMDMLRGAISRGAKSLSPGTGAPGATKPRNDGEAAAGTPTRGHAKPWSEVLSSLGILKTQDDRYRSGRPLSALAPGATKPRNGGEAALNVPARGKAKPWSEVFSNLGFSKTQGD